MNIKDKLTIVIPSKNEEKYIERTIGSLVKQYGIKGTKVIVADNYSKDKTRAKVITLRETYKDILKIELVDGGNVAYARNYGSHLAKTKYVLFLDADSVIIDPSNIQDNIKLMENHKLDLMTCKVKSVGKDIRTAIAFKLFNIVNKVISIKTPFAVGTYFLTRADKFKKLGEFDITLQHSEDYYLSKKYKTNKFKISKHFIGQDDRRFKKMGYTGMVKLLIKGYINRNNKDFFKKDIGYWL